MVLMPTPRTIFASEDKAAEVALANNLRDNPTEYVAEQYGGGWIVSVYENGERVFVL